MILNVHRDFESAGKAVLSYLHQHFGFALWIITRVQGDDWIVLQSEDHGYSVAPGKILQWADSFCCQMVRGNGPRMAPDSEQVPAYASAPIGQQLPIRAYIGVPLYAPDGSLFGTLCAIDPTRQPESIARELELVELLASMLSTILAGELELTETRRQNERLTLEVHADSMTGLANRRAWDELLAREDERCRRYGHLAVVFVIDLDDLKRVNDGKGHAAGDALIRSAADALRTVARQTDLVARLGGDEFGLLAVECAPEGVERIGERLRQEFAERGIRASIGAAMHSPAQDLQATWREADQRMYLEKRSKRR